MTTLGKMVRSAGPALALAAVLLAFGVARADHLPPPVTVSIPGNFQAALGCPGDWMPDCAVTHLAYNGGTDRWTGSFTIPAGNYEYKVAINDMWDENYGVGGAQNGPNILLSLADPTLVVFTYDPHTHVITHNTGSQIVVAPGSFQSEVGCSGDWMPDCLNSQLSGPNPGGLFEYSTTQVPPGCYEFKIAIGLSWNENYGEGGVMNGANLPFCVVEPGSVVTITWDPVTHVPTVAVNAPVPVEVRTWGGIKAGYR